LAYQIVRFTSRPAGRNTLRTAHNATTRNAQRTTTQQRMTHNA
jgi:hypothetical protein